MSTLVVVEEILREVKRPVSVREIVERAKGHLPTKSKTPDTVVARDLAMDIKKKSASSKFIRTSPGRYTMREFVAGPLCELQPSEEASSPLRGQVISASQTHERAAALHSAATPPVVSPRGTTRAQNG